MSAASALASGPEASPKLAAAAARMALERAGLARAEGVVLFLSAHFARQAQAAVTAAAREAGCLQVFGTVANGLLTESGWSLDQPAAAALALGDGLGLRNPGPGHFPRIALAGMPTLPAAWVCGAPRHGLVNGSFPVWQQARLGENSLAEAAFCGAASTAVVSTGLQLLGKATPIGATRAYDVDRVGDQGAQESLWRALPRQLRTRPDLPVHLISAVLSDGRPIPLLAANSDGSLTFAEPVAAGTPIRWGLRQPLAAEIDMRSCLETAAGRCRNPAFGLMFSCIGRGPLFYGSDDLDLLAFRQRLPGIPLLGAYGSGQIVALDGRNCQYQNSVLTLLFEQTP